MVNSAIEKKVEFAKTIIDGVEIKRCEKSHQSYKKHLHHELSIGIIEEGTTTVNFANAQYTFTEGDGIIIPPYMSHICSPDDIDHWRVVMLYINPAYYQDKLVFNDLVKLTGDCVARLNKFIESLESEMDTKMNEEALIELLVFLEGRTQKQHSNDTSINSISRIRQVKNFIEQHYTDELSLTQIEEIFGINKSTLIRNFQRYYNTAPIAYQLQLKVAEVKRCLSKGEDVFDLCERVGFYDQAHLIREFKKMNGISPMAYLKNIHQH